MRNTVCKPKVIVQLLFSMLDNANISTHVILPYAGIYCKTIEKYATNVSIFVFTDCFFHGVLIRTDFAITLARIARVLKSWLLYKYHQLHDCKNERNHHYISKFVTKNNHPSFLFLLLSKDTGQNEKRNKREIRWNSFSSTDRTDLAKVKDRIVLNATCGYCSSSCLFLCGFLFRCERYFRAHL